MKLLKYCILFLSLTILSIQIAEAKPNTPWKKFSKKTSVKAVQKKGKKTSYSKKISAPKKKITSPRTPYNGWDFLVARLKKDGITEREIRAVYLHPDMPELGRVPFSLNPKESSSLYEHFTSEKKIHRARAFLEANAVPLSAAEKQFQVNRYVIAALLLVESDYGRMTGREVVVNRLSRLAALSEPSNVEWNYYEQLKKDASVTFEGIKKRAAYLEETFYPEIPALFEIGRKNKINPISIRGSSAGAFGLPQFLPTSFLRFGVDANNDGHVSLFSMTDAIASAAKFLHHYHWDDGQSKEHARQVLWNYNRSNAYVDGVLNVAVKLSKRARSASNSDHLAEKDVSTKR